MQLLAFSNLHPSLWPSIKECESLAAI